MKVNQKKCRICKTHFKPFRTTQTVCSVQCAIEEGKKKEVKRQAIQEQAERKRIREEKAKLKTLSSWKSDLQDEINFIVRHLDKDLPCISSGLQKAKWNAGHYHSVGSSGNIRFHLDNIHKQSVYSNKHRSGDDINYRKGLIERYGIEYADYVENLHAEFPVLKATIPDVKRWIKIARQIKRRLKNGEEMTREQINKELGIYDKH